MNPSTATRPIDRARLLAERLYTVLRSNPYGPHPSHDAATVLQRVERYLYRRGDCGSFGYDGYLESDDYNGDKPNCLYLNAGDTYAETLLWDGQSEEFIVTTFGDWIEAAEQWHTEETGEIRCAYCGEWTEAAEVYADTCCTNCGRYANSGLYRCSGDDDDDEEHVCTFGPVELSRFTGNPHRTCTECGLVTLDLTDDDSDE